MHAEGVAYTHESVLNLSVALTLIAIGGHLAVTQDLSVTLVKLRIVIITGGVLLLIGGFGFAAGFLAMLRQW